MTTQPWIQTHTGKAFDLLDPQPEQVDVHDIAHALSNLCRFTGHSSRFYSVAQHSCLVAEITADLWRTEHGYECPPAAALRALMHDAAEAYVGDVSTPLKRALRGEGTISEYDVITRRVERAIEVALMPRAAVLVPRGIVCLNTHVVELIKRADMIALSTEHAALFDGPPPRSWGVYLPPPWTRYLPLYTPGMARSLFLQRFGEYGGVL